MAEIHFDPAHTTSQLRAVVESVVEQATVHNSTIPQFPVSSAGRDFAGHGQRIQSMLARLHARGAWRLDNFQSTVRAASLQAAELTAGDQYNADTLQPEAWSQ